MKTNTTPGVTETPASSISSADFDSYEGSEAALGSLDAVLANSPMMAALRKMSSHTGSEDEPESLPTEDEQSDTAQDESAEEPEADDTSEETADEEVNESEDDEENQEGDDESTAAENLVKEDDVDWTFKIPVKVDGKVEHVSLEQLRKGYATDQHLSQKGRELGELKKQAEAERAEKLADVIQLTEVLNTELQEREIVVANQFKTIKDKYDAAKKEGDTFAARELKEKMEDLRDEFGQLRQQREGRIAKVADAYKKKVNDERQELLVKYQKEAPALIPGYTDEVAQKCRDFAIKAGLPAEILEGVYDARVVKFINDFRLIAESIEKGSTKRKAADKGAPQKQIPMRKGTPAPVKEAKAKQVNRAKVLSGKGGRQDELDFLKSISSISKKLK